MKKILFLIQLPPPVHGASVVNEFIRQNKAVNSSFIAEFLNISPASELSDLGKISFKKLIASGKIYISALRLFIKFKPKLVYLTLSPHGAAFYKDGLLALLLKLFGANLVFHMHGKGIAAEAQSSCVKNNIYKLVFKKTNVIHLSDSLFFDVASIRDQTKSIIALPNSVPAPPDIIFAKNKNLITFIYISNLIPSKGAHVLLKAAALLPSELQHLFRIKFVGATRDNLYQEKLETLRAKSNFDNILFVGAKYNDEKYLELLESDVFVLPTSNDCFPLSILEAMSCGLAVISTQEGAIPTIIENGVTGDILEECTPEALAAVMQKYIENPAYLKACGVAGKVKYNSEYTEQIFEQNFVSILQDLIHDR